MGTMSPAGMGRGGGVPLLASPSSHGPAVDSRAVFLVGQWLLFVSATGLSVSVGLFCQWGNIDWGAAGGGAGGQPVNGDLSFIGGGLKIAVSCQMASGSTALLAAFSCIPGLALVGG